MSAKSNPDDKYWTHENIVQKRKGSEAMMAKMGSQHAEAYKVYED